MVSGKVTKTPARRQGKRNNSQVEKMEQAAKAASVAASSEAMPTASNSNGAADPASTNTVYFWRETELETGYLSQWYPCEFTDKEGVVYKTAEHYMMYQKAILFNDPVTGAKILKGKHPREVKNLGRQVKNFDQALWEEHRYRIVRDGNYFKFTQAVSEVGLRRGKSEQAPLVGESLRALLLSTRNAELVEASPFDRIWGIGFREKDAEQSRAAWGLNLLGKALVEVRGLFREDAEKAEAEAKAKATDGEGEAKEAE